MRRPIPKAALALLALLPIADLSAQIVPPEHYGSGRAVSAPLLRAPQPFSHLRTRPYAPLRPQIASDGTGFLAVWNDQRFGNDDVVGSRLTEEGTLVDPAALPVVATWRRETADLVLSNGREYVVFARSTTPSLPGATLAARVQPDGRAALAGHFPDVTAASGAWNGSRYGVVFVKSSAGYGMKATLQLFDETLNPLETVTVSETSERSLFLTHRTASVAAGHGNFLVVWETRAIDAADNETQQVVAQLFDANARPLNSPRELFSRPRTERYPESAQPVVSWNGTSFLAAWNDRDVIRGATISSSGDVSRPFQIASQAFRESKSIAWDGHSHLLVWKEYFNPSEATFAYRAATLTATADVLDHFTLLEGTSSGNDPAVASNGRVFVVLAGDRRLSVSPTSLNRVVDLGPLAYAYQSQRRPRITAGATRLLAVWEEAGNIYASRISPAGQVFGDPLHLGGTGDDGMSFAAASAGDHHLVVFRGFQHDRAEAVIVTPAGQIRPAGPLPTSASYWPTLAASSGSDFAIPFTLPADAASSDAVKLAIVSTDGSIRVHDVGTSPGAQIHSIAWNGSAYAVFWRRCLSRICDGQSEDRLTVVSRAGAILSDVSVASSHIVQSVADERGLLIVSFDPWPEMTGTLVTRRIGYDGTVSSTSIIGDSNLAVAVLARSGAGYILVGSAPIIRTSTSATHVIHLDGEGRATQEVKSVDDTLPSDVTHAFGTTWLTFTAAWQPVPALHEGTVSRAFFRALAPRVRAVRR